MKVADVIERLAPPPQPPKRESHSPGVVIVAAALTFVLVGPMCQPYVWAAWRGIVGWFA